jgi:hypothetical protein
MAKRGPKPGPTGPECVRLFGAGLAAADIARQLGLTPAAVYAHQRAAGAPPAARRRPAPATTPDAPPAGPPAD